MTLNEGDETKVEKIGPKKPNATVKLSQPCIAKLN
jgi:hypothetical protein